MRVGFHEGLLVLSGQFGVLLFLFRVEGCPPLAQYLCNTSVLEVRVLLSDYTPVSLTEYKKCIHRSLLWLIWTNVCGEVKQFGQWLDRSGREWSRLLLFCIELLEPVLAERSSSEDESDFEWRFSVSAANGGSALAPLSQWDGLSVS